MRAYLPHLSRYQREVFDLGQSIARATRCVSDLPEGAKEPLKINFPFWDEPGHGQE